MRVKCKPNMLLHIIITIFFFATIYFSYFTFREVIIHNVVSEKEYISKFASYKLERCDYEEGRIKMSREECISQGRDQILEKRAYDYKRNFIKNGLGLVVAFVTFFLFAVSSVFYRKK